MWGEGGGQSLRASLDPSQAETDSSVSWFLCQLLLLGTVALWLHLDTLSFVEKGMGGLQLTSLLLMLHLQHLTSLVVPVLQTRAVEQWGSWTRSDGTMLVSLFQGSQPKGWWSTGGKTGPQVFLPQGAFFHHLHSSLA